MYRAYSERFVYRDHLKRVGECRLDVVQSDSDRIFVVFTELNENHGPSVTNAVECLANDFLRQYDYDPEHLQFVERYESHPDDLDAVDFRFDGRFSSPVWHRMKGQEAEQLLAALDSPPEYP